MDIGDKIKKIRREKNLTQKELAQKLGTSPQNLAQYENGKRNPKLKTIRQLADALDVPLYELVTDWGEFSQEELLDDFVNSPSQKKPDVHDYKFYGKFPMPYIIQDIYGSLNATGKKKLADYAEDLTKIPEYRADSAPDPAPVPADPQQKKD